MREWILSIIDIQGHLTEQTLDFSRKEVLTLGRDKSSCDIVIPDPVVSKIHGRIGYTERQIWYQDQKSRNGTFVGVGSRRRLLRQTSGPVILPENEVLCIGSPTETDSMVLLLFSEKHGRTVWKYETLPDKGIYIGRDQSCQISLENPCVSKQHCRIYKRGGFYVLEDLHSTNGVFVNAVSVRSQVVLRDKDIIQILGYRMIFCHGGIYYQTEAEGISLQICDVSKAVGKGRRRKEILHQVSCEIEGNEFVAIIGGSGAGKTTLMNAISGFEPDFSGQVFCNGINLKKNFHMLKSMIGFVPQQDIIYENLTLKRMLYYSAKMRMPDDAQSNEIEKRIQDVLKMVELTEHQNTLIRKLSGGQKKRASIAVELLADPKLFFLDEPTSGLDPGTEKSLMLSLKQLSRQQNKTIVMVTHTTANLDLCDKILFMGPGGRLCFCGNVKEALRFYQTDELVDIYNLISEKPQVCEQRYRALAGKNNVNDHFDGSGKEELTVERKSSGFRQFRILAARYAELMANDRQRLAVLILQPCFIAILLWIVSDEDIFSIYESTKSMLFALSCSGIWIGLFNSIQEICKERVIVKREYMANLKLPGYILSKFIFQAVLGAIQAFLLSGIFLCLVHKNREGIFLHSFFPEILLTVWLTVLASLSLGFVISAVVKSGDKAMAAAPFVLIVQLLFSGILFTLEGSGKIISYCTVSRWSVEALGSIAGLNSLDLRMQEQYPMLKHEAEAFFKASAGHVATAWGIMLGMTVLFLIVSMAALRGVAKDRR